MMTKLKNSEFLMTKRLKKRLARQNKERSGCMSGLTSVFDFRRGRITRRMLSDNGMHLSKDNKDSKDIHPRIESQNDKKTKKPTFYTSHMRVKELMEEEEVSDDETENLEENKLEDLMNELLMIHQKRNEEQKSKSQSKPIERSNSFSNEPAARMPRNFFRRRSKSHECISMNETNSSVHHKRSVSQFSFMEIKKRLKNAIKKDRRSSGCLEKRMEKEDFGNMSDRVSNIYVEAKKHLSEMLNNGYEDTEITTGDLPKTLGKILSFQEYNSPSLEGNTPTSGSSPRNGPEDGFVTVVNKSQPVVTDDDCREPEVEGVLEIVKPPSPEESRVEDFKDLTEEIELSCSPVASPLGSSLSIYRNNEEIESSADDKNGKPSPVSVLDPFFSDDDISPARTVSRFAETSMKPLRIRFEKTLTPSEDREICIRNHVENEESEFEYVEAVLLASDMNWAEFEARWLSSAQILDPSLFDELEIFSSHARPDQRLLFDSVNEILRGVCDRSLGFFTDLSSFNNVKSVLRGMSLINEVWGRIELRIKNVCSRSLDQLVKKDFEVSGTWMDLRSDTGEVVTDIGELIFEDMIGDTVLSLMDE